jgi:hypothetical protein
MHILCACSLFDKHPVICSVKLSKLSLNHQFRQSVYFCAKTMFLLVRTGLLKSLNCLFVLYLYAHRAGIDIFHCLISWSMSFMHVTDICKCYLHLLYNHYIIVKIWRSIKLHGCSQFSSRLRLIAHLGEFIFVRQFNACFDSNEDSMWSVHKRYF